MRLSRIVGYVLLIAALAALGVGAAEPPHLSLRINEVLADNTNFALPGPPGEQGFTTPDLVEIYNPTEEPVLLSGLYLTDAAPDETLDINWWRFPPGTWIEAGGYRTVVCDGSDTDTRSGCARAAARSTNARARE